MSNKLVYYDKKYPSSCTKSICEDISLRLSKRNFTVLDAESLKHWIKDSISKKTASKSVLVFALTKRFISLFWLKGTSSANTLITSRRL